MRRLPGSGWSGWLGARVGTISTCARGTVALSLAIAFSIFGLMNRSGGAADRAADIRISDVQHHVDVVLLKAEGCNDRPMVDLKTLVAQQRVDETDGGRAAAISDLEGRSRRLLQGERVGATWRACPPIPERSRHEPGTRPEEAATTSTLALSPRIVPVSRSEAASASDGLSEDWSGTDMADAPGGSRRGVEPACGAATERGRPAQTRRPYWDVVRTLPGPRITGVAACVPPGVVAGCGGRASSCGPRRRRRRCGRPVRVGTSTTGRCHR